MCERKLNIVLFIHICRSVYFNIACVLKQVNYLNAQSKSHETISYKRQIFYKYYIVF